MNDDQTSFQMETSFASFVGNFLLCFISIDIVLCTKYAIVKIIKCTYIFAMQANFLCTIA